MVVVPYLLIALGVVAAVLLIRYFINKHKHTERKTTRKFQYDKGV
jgi:hypothetical protein